MRTAWRNGSGALLIVASLATTAFTQTVTTAPPGSSVQTTVGQPSSSGGYSATFTGCVERADQVAAPTASSPGTDTDSQSFVLTNALRGAAGTTQPGPVGTSGTAVKSTSYKLDGAADTLNPNVGKRVEITGIVSLVMEPPAASSGSTIALAAPARLKVESIKPLAETCAR